MERLVKDLVARSKLALQDPELTKIAREAKSANAAYNQARDLLKDRKGLRSWNELSQEDLKPAQSCRFAWMLRKKSEREFEKQTSALRQREEKVSQKPKKEEKAMEEKEKNPLTIYVGKEHFAEIVTRYLPLQHPYTAFQHPFTEIRFPNTESAREVAIQLMELELEKGLLDKGERVERFMNLIIQILKKKFGIDVKICGNCRYYGGGGMVKEPCTHPSGEYKGRYREIDTHYDYTCGFDGWAPKEVSEEISRKAYCPKCDKRVEVKIKQGTNPSTVNCPECHRQIDLRSGCGAKQ